jgi:hypothetical protein
MTPILISMSLVVSTVCAFGLAKAFDKLTGVKIPCQLLFIYLVLFPAPGAAATQGLADQSSIQVVVHTNINASTSMVAVDAVASWAQLVTACATPSANITLSPTFQMGAYNNEIDFSGKVIIIFGSNATLDAGQKGRFFNGDGSKGKTSLELHGITLKNGHERDFGGAIFIQNGTLVIHDSTFATNGKIDGATTNGMGGAIGATTADVKIYTCIFESNTAYHSGAIYVGSGTQIEIYTSIFKNNTTPPGSGGAISAGPYDPAARLLIHDSAFDTNTAGAVGGAVYTDGADVQFYNCTFTSNMANPNMDGGGAVWVSNANANFTGCIFNGNDGTKGHNDITRDMGQYVTTSNVTFACANGTVGASVTMKPGESEIADPPPTSLKCTALNYSCDGLTGTCKQDQSGHFPTKSACSGVCTAQPTPAPCQVPRNCGQHNNSVVCGHVFTGCEFVCGKGSDPATVGCCHANIHADEICNGCVEQLCKPVPPLPPPITTKYSCVTMLNYHCIESSSGFYPLAKDCENACPPPSLSP